MIETIKLPSPHQAGPTHLRLLVPDRAKQGKPCRVLLVLPVEAQMGHRWGDPMPVIATRNLHNKHDLICVYPTFTALPWYADHPTDPAVAQERHLLETVMPWIASRYKVVDGVRGWLLAGFSKSGWGAATLLLRHPDRFAKAAVWDAPLMLADRNRFGAGPIFATQANFEKYELTRLAPARAELFRNDQPHATATDAPGESTPTPRLLLAGAGNFADQHDQFAALLRKHQFPHTAWDRPLRKHHWESGWLPEAITWLAQD